MDLKNQIKALIVGVVYWAIGYMTDNVIEPVKQKAIQAFNDAKAFGESFTQYKAGIADGSVIVKAAATSDNTQKFAGKDEKQWADITDARLQGNTSATIEDNERRLNEIARGEFKVSVPIPDTLAITLDDLKVEDAEGNLVLLDGRYSAYLSDEEEYPALAEGVAKHDITLDGIVGKMVDGNDELEITILNGKVQDSRVIARANHKVPTVQECIDGVMALLQADAAAEEGAGDGTVEPKQ